MADDRDEIWRQAKLTATVDALNKSIDGLKSDLKELTSTVSGVKGLATVVADLKESLEKYSKTNKDEFASKSDLQPVKLIVYGFVSLILSGVVVAAGAALVYFLKGGKLP